MSRNMKETNQSIFDRLAQFVLDSRVGVGDISLKGTRFIKTNDEEKIWLKNLKIKNKLPILPRLTTSVIEINNQEYFAIVGWDPKTIKCIDEIFFFENSNAGLVTALISELKISIRQHSDPLAIANGILSQSREAMPEYAGHEFNEIASVFDPFGVYQILEESPIKGDDIVRLSCLFISQNPENLILAFSDDTLKVFRDIVLNGPTDIPFENFILGLTSFSWKYAFLDIYRCIERLFALPFFQKIHAELSPMPDFKKFVSLVEEITGWRPKEDTALKKILDNAPSDLIKTLSELKKRETGTEAGTETEKLANWFYQVRNSIVHYRLTSKEVKFKDADWDLLFQTSLILTRHLYLEYKDKIEILQRV